MLLSFNAFSQEKETTSGEEKSLRRYLFYPVGDTKGPNYRKVFDEYILDLEYLQRHKKLPESKVVEEDLSQMSRDEIIELSY